MTESEIVTSDEAKCDLKLKCFPLLFTLLEEMLITGINEQAFITSLVDVCLKWLNTTSIGVIKVLSKIFRELSLDYYYLKKYFSWKF